MREAVHPQHSVVAAHDLCFAAPIADPFDWVSQSLADKFLWVGEDVGDLHAVEFGIVERKDKVGKQYTVGLALGDESRRCCRHSRSFYQPLRPSRDKHGTSLRRLALKLRLGAPLQI